VRVFCNISVFALAVIFLFVFATKGPDKNVSYAAHADELYQQLSLEKDSLSKDIFELALKGLEKGIQKNIFDRYSILTIVDMSKSSNAKRMYVIDLERKTVLFHTYVAHGRNTGEEFARSFSNEPESQMSSIGFYKTEETYDGLSGLALRLKGLDKGYNDNAREREIVVHGAVYVGEGFIKKYRMQGRSWGCPAVPMREHKEIINTIKDGTCLFVFYPEVDYLMNSPFLNDRN
jgi:hypothetical protein